MAKQLRATRRGARADGRGDNVHAFPFKKRPPSSVHLPIKCVVYVPSTCGDKPISKKQFMDRRESTAQELVRMFGGCRETLAVGRYENKDGEIIEEDVAVLTGYGQPEKYAEKRERFLKWLLKKKEEWEQESLAFEFGGDLYFI